MRFWFDKSVPKPLTILLKYFDNENMLQHHSGDQRVSLETTDLQLMHILGHDDKSEDPWIIVTMESDQDKGIYSLLPKMRVRRILLEQHWAKKRFQEQAWRLLRIWPSVVRISKKTNQAIISVPLNSTPDSLLKLYSISSKKSRTSNSRKVA